MSDSTTELEIRLAFLEKTQEEQNQVIFQQQKTIDGLNREVQVLKERVAGMADSAGGGDATVDEPPPHY